MAFFLVISQTIYQYTSYKCSLSSLEYSEDPKEKYYETRIFNDYNTRLFIKDIKNVNWDGVLSCDNPQNNRVLLIAFQIYSFLTKLISKKVLG